jgi:hypothetical protein
MNMVENSDKTTIYFESDDEFLKWALNPEIKLKDSDVSGMTYFDIDFTDDYMSALKAGKHFVIMDDDSKICRRKAVTLGTVSKKVQNIDPYFYDEFEEFENIDK